MKGSSFDNSVTKQRMSVIRKVHASKYMTDVERKKSVVLLLNCDEYGTHLCCEHKSFTARHITR
eukprot:m.62481 g.62481  ORF g.62481 m.62481 type:complete len:64 (-) comp15807_c0_seq1:87-278(-)